MLMTGGDLRGNTKTNRPEILAVWFYFLLEQAHLQARMAGLDLDTFSWSNIPYQRDTFLLVFIICGLESNLFWIYKELIRETSERDYSMSRDAIMF